MSSEKSRNDLEFFSNANPPDMDVGPFRVEPAEGRVLRDGEPVPLTPKAFDLLVLLLSHRGRLVTREALLSRLWPDTFVDESNLTGAIWAVRKALGAAALDRDRAEARLSVRRTGGGGPSQR